MQHTCYYELQVIYNHLKVNEQWGHGVIVITTAQLHSTKPELESCAGSNPACGMSEI